MRQKIIKIGNSAGITFPLQVREELGLYVGDEVLVERKENSIVLQIPEVKRKSRGGVTAKFMRMVDDFVSEHKDVLEELSKR